MFKCYATFPCPCFQVAPPLQRLFSMEPYSCRGKSNVRGKFCSGIGSSCFMCTLVSSV